MLSEENNIHNIDDEKSNIDINNNPHLNMGLAKLISIFVIGFVGLLVIEILVELFLSQFSLSKAKFDGIKLFVSFGLILLCLNLVIGKDIKHFKNDYKEWKKFVIGVLIGLIIVMVSISYTHIINLFRPYEVNDNESRLRAIIDVFPVLSVIFMCFVGPLCEELTYRVGLFNIFYKKKWLAYVLATLVFTFMHFSFDSSDIIGELINLPIYLFCAFALTFSYDKFGLASSLSAHTVNNLYAVIAILVAKSL